MRNIAQSIVYLARMSGEAECNVAARYRTVRKHLDNLGYKQALSLDALPLIETLLADLIHTTDSLKHFKAVAQENVEVGYGDSVTPIKKVFKIARSFF